jgi:hypothetical protein
MKYDIDNNNITIFLEFDIDNFNNGTMVYTGVNKLAIVGGNDSILIDIPTKEILRFTRVPDKFLNRPLKSCRLVNGDTVVYRTTYITEDNLNNDMLLFNRENLSYTTIVAEFNGEIAPTGVLPLNDGRVLLFKEDEHKTVMFLYE